MSAILVGGGSGCALYTRDDGLVFTGTVRLQRGMDGWLGPMVSSSRSASELAGGEGGGAVTRGQTWMLDIDIDIDWPWD